MIGEQIFTIAVIFVSYFSACYSRVIKPVNPAAENCYCQDFYGSCRQNFESWIEDSTWNYECKNNLTLFAGCSSSGRGNGVIISPNSIQSIQGFTFSCEQNSQTLRYEEESRCTVNGTDLHIGDTFRDGYFQKRCLESGVWVSGCYYTNSETSQQDFLEVGTEKQVGRIIHHCSIATDYPGRIQYWTQIDETVTVPSAAKQSRSSDQLNFLSSPPTPWILQYADQFIRTDVEPRTKIRFLTISKWTKE